MSHQPSIGAHLRDVHLWTLAESVKWAPRVMWQVHDEEHERLELDHSHDERGQQG